MDERRKTYLLKLVRGKDFRRALHAIAELRAANDPALANAVTESADADEQRAFQSRVARIALEGAYTAWWTHGELLARRIGAPGSSTKSGSFWIVGPSRR